MPTTVIDGSLLEAPEQYIVHQCNCVSKDVKFLAAKIFARYPHANVYRTRTAHDTPGTIAVRGAEGTPERPIIALFGQIYPGKPKYPMGTDSASTRERHFASALERIGALPGLRSLAFPWKIGCNAAGGDWGRYKAMLDRFADAHPDLRVVIYRLPGAL